MPNLLLVSDLSDLASEACESIARSADLPINWEVVASVRVTAPIVAQVQRRGCGPVRIIFSAEWIANLPRSTDTNLFRKIAFRSIQAANRVYSRNALITGDIALALTEDRRKLRRIPVLLSDRESIHDRYFSTAYTLTVTDRLTGRTLSGVAMRESDISLVERKLKNQLSRELFLDDEARELYDLLEDARDSAAHARPTSAEISAGPDTISVSYSYGSDSNS